jgi:hypothetical protein
MFSLMERAYSELRSRHGCSLQCLVTVDSRFLGPPLPSFRMQRPHPFLTLYSITFLLPFAAPQRGYHLNGSKCL